jgi:acetyltransferase-like isoleucine patch superfamily enzyme
MNRDRTLPWDWHTGVIPENVVVDETAYIETTYSFGLFRSKLSVGLKFGRGSSCYKSTMFDVGPGGRVKLGEYALVHGARIICDSEILIGDYSLISWNVVLMDSYRSFLTVAERRQHLESIGLRNSRSSDVSFDDIPSKPIRIERNVWIGFDSCVLPGVTIGEGAVVGAKSVVFENVPSFTVVAGNPARVIRQINSQENARHD